MTLPNSSRLGEGTWLCWGLESLQMDSDSDPAPLEQECKLLCLLQLGPGERSLSPRAL